jgi:hypothetical protein
MRAPDRLVVLYSHPLLGEGLGRMLASEPGLVVTTVSLGTLDALDEALAGEPDVVVFEEGGPIGILDVMRRTGARVIVDVDITSSTAWTLRRQALRSAPDEVLGAIREALAGGSGRARCDPIDEITGQTSAVDPSPRPARVAAGS